MRFRLWRSSPEGHREVEPERVPLAVADADEARLYRAAFALDPAGLLLAYRLGDADELAEEIYARARSDGLTGFLELREIPDPWVCRECGLGYQEGAHTDFGFDGPDAHDYTARAPREEPCQ